MYESWIDKKVRKLSGKPFKSKDNTVKGIVDHPQTKRPVFTFVEDDSYVEAKQCELVAG